MHDGVQPDLSVTQQVQLAEKRKMEDNAMAKRKSTMIYKSRHRKLEFEQRESHKNRNEPVHRHGKQFCYTIDTRRVTLDTNLVISNQPGNDGIVMTNGTYPRSSVTQILHYD
jgi:hypothetical protein